MISKFEVTLIIRKEGMRLHRIQEKINENVFKDLRQKTKSYGGTLRMFRKFTHFRDQLDLREPSFSHGRERIFEQVSLLAQNYTPSKRREGLNKSFKIF